VVLGVNCLSNREHERKTVREGHGEVREGLPPKTFNSFLTTSWGER